MSYFDENEEEEFKDQPEEITPGKEAEQVEVKSTRPVRPSTPVVQLDNEPQYEEEADEEQTEEEQEEETATVLTDARLRLEQGKLYELIMKHDLFDGVEADAKAIKNVQKEIRAYAQERMEIMLGMRQEQQKESGSFPMELFPFNSLEVEALKALAAAATKGASRDAEPLDLGAQAPAARVALNPIGKNTGRTTPAKIVQKAPAKKLAQKPVAPVKRKVDANVQRILQEEGVTLDQINEVFDPNKRYLTPEELAQLTPDQLIERNRMIKNKPADNPHKIPMPSAEHIEQMIVQRAQSAADHPQMKQIMGLLAEAQAKKGQ